MLSSRPFYGLIAAIGFFVLCAGEASALRYWHVSDDGVAKWQHLNVSSVTVGDMGFGDFNGDGKSDIFYGTGSRWLISYGGTSRWSVGNASSYRASNLLFGDFTGDGRTDVFRTSGGKWYISERASSAWRQINSSNMLLSHLAVGDFNGDGRADIFNSRNGRWYVSYSGTGPWTQINRSNYEVKDLAFADFNGDGRTDILRATGSKWFISFSGTGSWTAANNSSLRTGQLHFADMTGDGAADVFRASGSRWYISERATGRWRAINRSGAVTDGIRLADLRGDGRADVIVTGRAKDHALTVRRHSSVSASSNQIDVMMRDATDTLRLRDRSADTACKVRLRRDGPLNTFSTGNGTIDTSRRLENVFSVSGNVKIVSAVDYCGGRLATNIIGCGKINNKNLIIESAFLTDNRRGRLLAHEFGHNVGLPNLNDLTDPANANRLMRRTIDNGTIPGLFSDAVTSNECGSFR